ncbi:ABC transporter substrate-binding protein [Candidatus Palauibacter sp.]|uniref:ABC transporter substrate-binding protein n=1 Tax=Candidatus Palauibacter sp. TaxID=3101350 RepID=UPI003AF2DE2C
MARRRRSRFNAKRCAAGRQVALGCSAALIATVGCVLTTGSPPEDAGAPVAVDTGQAEIALQVVESDYTRGNFAAASGHGDSLSLAWANQDLLRPLADRALSLAGRALEAQNLPGAAADRYGRLLVRAPAGPLRDETVERLVRVLADTGREPEAVGVMLADPQALEAVGPDTFRELTSALTVAHLRDLADRHPPRTAAASIVHVQLARLLFVARESDEARRLAAGVLEGRPAEPERTTAELIAAAGTELSSGTARIGAILPLTGDLADVGELLREGIELAVDRHHLARPDGFDVALVLLDDESNPENTPSLVRSLERRGVVAIIGPLRSESFATATRARRNPRLPIISPTATEVLRPGPGSYTLDAGATRESDVAEALARWTIERLGLRRVGVLEPLGAGLGGGVRRFIRTIREHGGELVGHERYDPSLTTFQEPIEALAAVEPDVVFAPSPSATGVLSVAPQLFYYGLYNVIVLGSEAWADPAALRRLEEFATDHRVVGLTMDRVSAGTPWRRFVADYERKYRKSLRDNVIPALAHDATALALAALEGGRLPIPAALTAYLEEEPEVEGVTGLLRPETGRSVVHRATEIRMLVEGSPVDADRGELLQWLAEVRGGPSPFAPRDTVRADTLRRVRPR